MLKGKGGEITLLGRFMAVSTIPFILADWDERLPFPPMAIMGVIVFIYLIRGCFMDSMALVVLTVPVIYPGAIRLKFDPIWFGVQLVNEKPYLNARRNLAAFVSPKRTRVALVDLIQYMDKKKE